MNLSLGSRRLTVIRNSYTSRVEIGKTANILSKVSYSVQLLQEAPRAIWIFLRLIVTCINSRHIPSPYTFTHTHKNFSLLV